MNILRLKTTFLLLIILAIMSPPFVFSQIDYFGREIRTFLGIIVLLLLYLEYSKFKSTDIFIFFLLGNIIFLEIIFQRSSINNILSAYAVIFIAFSLFRLLKSNKLSLEIFLNLWFRFSLIVSIAAIISFLIHQFSSFNADILNFNSSPALFNWKYDYRMSIFGFTINKNFGFVELERVSSFFNEPQYAGMFFAFNMLLAKNRNKLMPRKYFVVSLLAGLLTFSSTFYLVFLVFLISYIIPYIKPNQIKTIVIPVLLMFFFLFLIFIYWFDISFDVKKMLFHDKTSFVDRFERNYYAIKLLYDTSISKLLFGHGINTYQKFNIDELGRGISSGFLYLLFEFGFLVSCVVLVMWISFSNKNRTLILISLIYLIVMPWYKYYFCWYAIILCGLSYTNTFRYKSADNKMVS